jgi:hypothetical protein
LLAYVTTDRTGYRHYKSDPAICRSCPLLASCTSNRNATRLVIRHVWADARERTDAHRLTPWGKRIYTRRKETVERSFADAKQLHGHRYARFKGLLAVTCQCLLAAAAQNIKKSLLPWRSGLPGPEPLPEIHRPASKQNPAENRRGLSAVWGGPIGPPFCLSGPDATFGPPWYLRTLIREHEWLTRSTI